MTQHEALESLARAIPAALRLADTGYLFESAEGYALVNAMHDVTGCDALYELAGEIATEANLPHIPSLAENMRATRQTIDAARTMRIIAEHGARFHGRQWRDVRHG